MPSLLSLQIGGAILTLALVLAQPPPGNPPQERPTTSHDRETPEDMDPPHVWRPRKISDPGIHAFYWSRTLARWLEPLETIHGQRARRTVWTFPSQRTFTKALTSASMVEDVTAWMESTTRSPLLRPVESTDFQLPGPSNRPETRHRSFSGVRGGIVGHGTAGRRRRLPDRVPGNQRQ